MSRVLLIGLDGADPALVRRWMGEGRLPHLARIAERGAFIPCESTRPPVTFPAWTTCVTGVNPGRHGIVDFTAMTPGAYGLRFLNAADRTAPAIWETLSQQGKRVCVMGVPGTYPPDSVNGVMVSGFDSPVCTAVDRSFVHPPSAYERVKAWRFADFQEGEIGPGWHARAHAALLKGIATKEAILQSLLNEEPWDFFMAVFGESDTVSHHFWLFHDKDSPRYRAGFDDAIVQIYERLDAAVGTLAAAAGSDTDILIVSDHGFGGAGTGVVHLNNWLSEQGYLSVAHGRDSLLKKAALRFAPEGMRGALFRRFRGMAARAESASRYGGIDWTHTRAWSEELNYFPSVRINLRGREPQGIVSPEDYDGVCNDLCAALEAWEPVAKAWRREELYDGPHVERAPDIVVKLALEDGYSHSCLRSRGGPAFRRMEGHEYLGGKEKGMTGNHRPTGILMGSMPFHRADSTLLDVAPTVYDLLGVPGPAMEGSSLVGDASGPPTAAIARAAGESPYTAEQEAAIEARLRGLGYFE